MSDVLVIEVQAKAGVSDPAGEGLAHDCRAAGLKVGVIRSSALYFLRGSLTQEEKARIGNDLLADPVIQTFHDAGERAPKATTVDVGFKAGVTDVIGESVLKGIRDLGITSVVEVRTANRYRLEGLRKAELGKTVALQFLANPLVQEVNVYVD